MSPDDDGDRLHHELARHLAAVPATRMVARSGSGASSGGETHDA